MKNNKILICIPARYASSRFKGKPLFKIAGKEMIKRVAEIAEYVCMNNKDCNYIVATDDKRIKDFCDLNNILVTMTSKNCKNGTERCWDVVLNMENVPELVVNLQGDNPLCPPWFIEEIIDTWRNDKVGQVFTPCIHLSWDEYIELKKAKINTPYSGTTVLIDKFEYALTFSKVIIPAIREEEKVRALLEKSPVRIHIGLYAYTYAALKQYIQEEPSSYELSEGLEQMRFIHNKIPIKMVEVDYKGRQSMTGVDCLEDAKKAENIIKEFGELKL